MILNPCPCGKPTAKSTDWTDRFHRHALPLPGLGIFTGSGGTADTVRSSKRPKKDRSKDLSTIKTRFENIADGAKTVRLLRDIQDQRPGDNA